MKYIKRKPIYESMPCDVCSVNCFAATDRPSVPAVKIIRAGQV
jgi:hypothetical protein